MRRELVYLHDLLGERVGAIGHGFFDLWTDERFRQSETMGFEIAADHAKADLIGPDIELWHRGRRFYVDEVEPARRGSIATITVRANALWYRLGFDKYVGSLVIAGDTPLIGAMKIVRGSGWSINEDATPDTGAYSMEAQDKSPLAMLREWEKITGLYLKFHTDERLVSLATTPGNDSGASFRYARNLTGVRTRTRAPAVTKLVPYGADDLSIAGVNGGEEYVEDFSWYTARGLTEDEARERFTKTEVWSDSSFIVDTDLLAAAAARLATRSGETSTYELSVVDLSEITGIEERTLRAGQTVRVYDPAFDVDLTPVITRIRREWLQPWRDKIELGAIPNPLGDGSTAGRPQASDEWRLFHGPTSNAYIIRNDGTYVTNRIPLRFRNGGQAMFHLDLWATGVGAGTMVVEVVDAVSSVVQFRAPLEVAYTDGEPVRAHLTWAARELVGAYDYRVRVTTVADGGPSASAGVDLTLDINDEASFYILAQGAVQETPTAPTSIVFDYTGAVQHWTIPDGVTEITIEANGAAGAGEQGVGDDGGNGGRVTATFVVTPGDDLDVYVGGMGGEAGDVGGGLGVAGWPNGGAGGTTPSTNNTGGGGGGSSDVRAAGAAFADAWIVAGGGGAVPFQGAATPGTGGFFEGTRGFQNDPVGGGNLYSEAATQHAGGTGGTGGAGAGSFNQGGEGGSSGNTLDEGGGGGGGGWYGGEGGRFSGLGFNGYQCSGAGGSGWVNADGGDIIVEDAARAGHGQITISWTDPLA